MALTKVIFQQLTRISYSIRQIKRNHNHKVASRNVEIEENPSSTGKMQRRQGVRFWLKMHTTQANLKGEGSIFNLISNDREGLCNLKIYSCLQIFSEKRSAFKTKSTEVLRINVKGRVVTSTTAKKKEFFF